MAGGTHPIQANPEPRKENFTEAAMPKEPVTDVRVVAQGGMVLRERVTRIDHNQGVTLAFTYTRLDENDNVMLTNNGEPMISPTHEVLLIGEHAQRLGDVAHQLKEGRKIGVARACDHFAGIQALSNLMKERLGV